MSALPIGPEVDGWPRPLPSRERIKGGRMTLEPINKRHVGDLWEAAKGAEESFTYMGYGPFKDRAGVEAFVAAHTARPDMAMWAVRPVVTGRAAGWLSLMNIEPGNAAIELGSIWFGPELQRTRAATEAMFLLLRHAADELGYRRLVWKCDARNAASRRAALRLGFIYEGTLRAHMVVKGRERDTAMFSMTAQEWPARRDALIAWLSPENFDEEGNALRGLASLRGEAA
ncbi:GNAT family N-acetyltransferase [Acidocella sp.]|uniref:GNAT family N-acetyltransferase n=1 Tax=Acidocella sp. TaxID=50710 RepID=UPI002613572E|nr:GNAT family protein [Acidocella sp.]